MSDCTTNRQKLTDILNGGAGNFASIWNSTAAADEFAPLPSGTYICAAISGELQQSSSGTPGYKLTFKVLEGEHTGRQVWHDLWLTPAALPMSKRDLLKLGIDTPAKLESPLPQGIRCKVRVTLRKGDDANEHNRVKTFEVIGVDAPRPDPFAPTPPAGGPGGAPATAKAEAKS